MAQTLKIQVQTLDLAAKILDGISQQNLQRLRNMDQAIAEHSLLFRVLKTKGLLTEEDVTAEVALMREEIQKSRNEALAAKAAAAEAQEAKDEGVQTEE